MTSLTKEQTDFIRTTAERNGFQCMEIETTGGTVKGDGYMGIIHFITVTDRDGDKELHLVLKSCHTNPDMRKQIPLRKVYLREIYMYQYVFSELISFQNHIGIKNPFTSVATFYGSLETELNEALLLQNLMISGYKLWNRRFPMNSEHVEMVIREYAKLHSVSLAFKLMQPEKFNELTKDLTDIFEETDLYKEETMKSMLKGQFQRGYEALGDHPAKEELKKFENEGVICLMESLKNPEDQMLLLHADCWCNNMMFKYEDTEKPHTPSNMCFLDFQASKIGTPVYDLAYYLYVCAPKAILLDLDRYLQIYHETFSENLRSCGFDPDKVFSMEMLKSHWKKYSKIGLFCAFTLLPVMMSEVEDIPDLTQGAQDDKHIFEAFINNKMQDSVTEMFNKRLFDLITFMVENEFL